MPRFAANLTMMFTEWPFLDRFDAAADAGFRAVEYLFPYDHAPDAVAARLQRNGLKQALFNMPPGDWAAGERGLAALPGRFAELTARRRDRALRYAEAHRLPPAAPDGRARRPGRSGGPVPATATPCSTLPMRWGGRGIDPDAGADQRPRHARLFPE